MANGCCYLVGNLILNFSGQQITQGCIHTVSADTQTDVNFQCPEPQIGSTIGTFSIVGYAADTIYTGCPGQATVTIPWGRRWECVSNTNYLLWPGEKRLRSSITGEVPASFVELTETLVDPYPSISASAQGGPTTIYACTTKTEGYGMTYYGGPLPFDTVDQSGAFYLQDVTLTNDTQQDASCSVQPGEVTIIKDEQEIVGNYMLLQNFSLSLAPGEIPTANYSYLYVLNN